MYNEWPDASSLGGFTFEAALALVVIIATLLTLLRWRSSLFDDVSPSLSCGSAMR